MNRVAMIVLVVIAVIVVLVVGGFAVFEQPAACGICHDESTIVKSWEKLPMGKKDVDCLDCHADRGFVGHLTAHFTGVGYLFAGKRTKVANVPASRCLVCHFSYKTTDEKTIAVDHYGKYIKAGGKCVDCHLQVAHVVLDKKRLPKTVADGWAGAENCAKCHVDVAKRWGESLHKDAIDVLRPKNTANVNCLKCHVVGYKKDGFVTLEKTPKLAGVQCENCHGKGEKHIIQPMEKNVPEASLAADMCGECHSGSHHNTFSDAEWKKTLHAQALDKLRAFDKQVPGAVQNECLACHSVDYILAPENAKPTLKTAKLALTCQACHSGHTTDTRLPKDQLCQSCHSGEGLKVGDGVHHPTKEMYFGKVIPGSGIFGPPTSKHVGSSIGCPNCHMTRAPYVSEAQPAKTGHDFLAKPEGCMKCHNDMTAETAQAKISELQAATVAGLAELKPGVDAAKAKYKTLSNNGKKKVKAEIKTPYDLAITGYDFVDQDGSKGFHNPEYAAKMLDLCRTNLPLFEAAAK